MTTKTNPSVLLVAAVAAGLAANLLIVGYYSDVPPLPVLGGMPFALLGIIEAVLAFVVRARIRRRPGARPVDALATARAVALAKASALGGSLIGGAWLGVLAFVAPRIDVFPVAGGDTAAAVVGAVCAALLVGAALWLEYCCRTPDDPDPYPPNGPGRPGDGPVGGPRR